MRALFWFSFLMIGYTYIGYAVLLAVYARFRRRPFQTGSDQPAVSIVMAAHNEEARLPAKLANLSALEYPHDQLEIVIASDGSTDGTVELLRLHAAQSPTGRIIPVILDRAVGKAQALNEAVRHASGEILVFLDVRQSLQLDAIAELVSCFADPEVGAVSGELLLKNAQGQFDALGLYWKIEKAIRKLESESGSVVGATGAIYAIRRSLFVNIPGGTILDDVLIPMNVARQGKRVIFRPTAIAHDQIFSEKGREFSRKVRTLTGNCQIIRLAPWLLSPRNPLLFRFISHKLLRLAVPWLLVVLLFTSASCGGAFYRTMFALQIAFYGLAVCGALSSGAARWKPVTTAKTFVMLNFAAGLALINFITGREVIWARPSQTRSSPEDAGTI